MDATLYYAIERIEGSLAELRKEVCALHARVELGSQELKQELERVKAEQLRLSAGLAVHLFEQDPFAGPGPRALTAQLPAGGTRESEVRFAPPSFFVPRIALEAPLVMKSLVEAAPMMSVTDSLVQPIPRRSRCRPSAPSAAPRTP